MTHTVTIPFGEDRTITLETGEIARQAHGAVTATVGGTVVLVAVVRSNKPIEGADFFPLIVDYREKHYAAGRIPGNFFRREGRPSTPETLAARLIDRTIRPLFPDGFTYEIQVYVTILSMDQKNPAEILALVAASAALAISDIPFLGPIGGTRVGLIGDSLVLNPTFEERERSALDLIVGGTRSAITMVESGADRVNEETMLKALEEGHKEVAKVAEGIEELVRRCGKEKMVFASVEPGPDIVAAVEELAKPRFEDVNRVTEKQERETAVLVLRDEVLAQLQARFAAAPGAEPIPNLDRQVFEAFESAYKKNVRAMVLHESRRADGRKLDEIRPITIKTGYLPMTHGSALFTRGQTQSLGVTTLGTVGDQQKIDDLLGISTQRFLLHYNFPAYSVGEVRRIGGPGRRELGHGALSQRALEPVLPSEEEFPYTIRVVSEVLESNGSSSMASVCSGCLSLMDAGVPIKAPVAGIAMGLIQEGDHVAILTDIMGLEDRLGDMDFKVAGTRDGITALQMDIKMEGMNFAILGDALMQGRDARLRILDAMAQALPEPRADLSPLAPRIEIVMIDPQRIGDLIGPSGKNIRGIIEATGAQIDVEDSGKVFICTNDGEAMAKAKKMVADSTADAEMGKIYTGKVSRITDFGAFVEILPKKDGLVHISELDNRRVASVGDVCREGDMLKVKVIAIDDQGKVRLSRKQALAEIAGASDGASFSPTLSQPGSDSYQDRPPRESHDRGEYRDRDRSRERPDRDRGGRGPRDRGGRDRDRGGPHR